MCHIELWKNDIISQSDSSTDTSSKTELYKQKCDKNTVEVLKNSFDIKCYSKIMLHNRIVMYVSYLVGIFCDIIGRILKRL